MLIFYLEILAIGILLIIFVVARDSKRPFVSKGEWDALQGLLFKSKYLDCYPYLFLGYLFCLFLFGRAFVIINIPTQPVPIFITEIFLFLSLPYFIFNLKKALEIPQKFLFPFLLFCGLGWLYLIGGLIRGNLFALRDIVLCLYPIFFVFLSFFVFQADSNKKKYFLLILIASVPLLVIGRLFLKLQGLLEGGPLFSDFLRDFLCRFQGFHFTFYYGVIICLLISIIIVAQKKSWKLISAFFLGINLYMVITFTCRSAWIALGAVLIFFLVSNWKKIAKTYVFWISIAMVIFALSIFDLGFRRGPGGIIMKGKAVSFEKIFERYFIRHHDSEKQVQSRTAKKNVIGNQGLFPALDRQSASSLANANWRASIWLESIEFAKKSMFLGRGFGVYPEYSWAPEMPLAKPRGIGVNSNVVSTHNELITILYKMGLVGLGLFIFFNVYIFRMGLSGLPAMESDFLKLVSWSALGSLLWWHVMALTSNMIDSPTMNVFLWTFIGMLLSTARLKDKKENGID